MDFRDIRRTVITAIFADDFLFERVVLKGGNALDIAYGLETRSSLDVDLSIEGDFENLEEVRGRFERSLTDRFESAGYVVFDFDFGRRPADPRDENPKWGGYFVEFKIIKKPKHDQLTNDVDVLRRQAASIGDQQQKRFRIDLSKNEYCKGKAKVEIDSYSIYVYTLPMIAVEKLRAICQQMAEYPQRKHKAARARDFYDLYVVIGRGRVDLHSAATRDLVKEIFAAKNVPLELLNKIEAYRDFHRPDWQSVVDTAGGKLRE